MKKSRGPATYKPGKFPTEQDLGLQDKDMTPGNRSGSGIPAFGGHKFGQTLNNEKAQMYNPSNRSGPGVPGWEDGHKFGKNDLPDPHPSYNPKGGS